MSSLANGPRMMSYKTKSISMQQHLPLISCISAISIITITLLSGHGIGFATAAKEVATNTFYVKITPDAANSHGDPNEVAHKIARRNGFHNLGPVLGSKHEYHFIHHALPHARTKRSVRHVRQLKADPHISHAFQQSGFKREKRYGVPRDWPTHPETEKRSPWVDLRQALDAEEDPNDFYNDVPIEDQGPNYDPHIVHDEGYFNRIQHASNHRNDKRG